MTYPYAGPGANIYQLVIGPTGVFVIETKNIEGTVRVAGDDLQIGDRRVAMVVEVAPAPLLGSLSLTVTPLICTHQAGLPWFNRRVRAIRIVSGCGLVEALRHGPAGLTTDQVNGLASLAVATLS